MIKVGIVDDHAIVRSGLKQFLTAEHSLQVVGEAATGKEALELVRHVQMDVLIMDLTMPGQSGLDILGNLRLRAPNVGILVLTGHSEAQYALSLLRKGASGFLSKVCDPAEIIEAVRTIAQGRRYITASVAEILAANFDQKRDHLPHQQLSDREFQIFLKLAQGFAVGEISKQVFLSVKTIASYRVRVMSKMNMSSNSDLTYYALKHHLLD